MAHRYRVDERDMYTMEYSRLSDGTYDILCTDHPHNPRSTNPVHCHLYDSGRVCVAEGHEPRTLDRAKAIAKLFMKGYSTYIRTGVFPNNKEKVEV